MPGDRNARKSGARCRRRLRLPWRRGARCGRVVLSRSVVAFRSPDEFRMEDQDFAFRDAAEVLSLRFVIGESVDELHQLVVGHPTRVSEGVHGFKRRGRGVP
jgi:hypothetical protein